MSYISRLIRRAIGRDDAQPEAGFLPKPPRVVVDRKIIKELISLSKKTGDVDVPERIQAVQRCNATISGLEQGSDKRKEINKASVSLLCGGTNEIATVELVPKTETALPFVKMVEKANEAEPDFTEVFNKLARGTETVPHPTGMSTLTFAFASLISLCGIYPDNEDSDLNKAAGFLDLYPLYGREDEDAADIRVVEAKDLGRGLLLPDAFFEDGERLAFLPKATTVLLILFNRNHNYIARKLLEENENGKWADPSTLKGDKAKLKAQDDEIFHLARRINCGSLRNIVINDFLKGLLGISPTEPNPSIDLFSDAKQYESEHHATVEFSLLYTWSSLASAADVEHIHSTIEENFDSSREIELADLEEFLDNYSSLANMDKQNRPCVGLERDGSTGAFSDTELAKVLQDATAAVASAFRPKAVSPTLKVLELQWMNYARDWQVCSFNDFRKLLRLPPYKDFAEWAATPEAATAAQEVYGEIEHLELYPGLRGEKTLEGPGFNLGRTMTQGLIADIVRMIRHDPNFTKDFNKESLTTWGFNELAPNPKNGAFGAYLPKLILRNLPNEYTYNSVYGLFPFTTPEKTKELLAARGDGSENDYGFGKPEPEQVKEIDDPDAIKDVLNDPETYRVPFKSDLERLTDGHGFLLGADSKEPYEADEFMLLKALAPDGGSLDRYVDWFRATTEQLLKKKAVKSGDREEIDLIQDVVNGVIVRWVSEKLCGVHLNRVGGVLEKELFERLVQLADSIFGNVDAPNRFEARTKAIETGKALLRFIEKNLDHVNADPDAKNYAAKIGSLLRELVLDEPPAHHTAHDFLARLAATGRSKQELSANALGLAVLSSVIWAQLLDTAVRFYLDDSRSAEREKLRELAKKGKEVNETVMGYIREAQRLNPGMTVHRRVAQDTVLEVDGESMELQKDDILKLDFTGGLDDDETIDHTREVEHVYSGGFYKYIGVTFPDQTLPEVLKAIFRLEDLRKEQAKPGTQSLPVSYHPPPRPAVGGKGKSPLRRPWVEYACNAYLLLLVAVLLTWIGYGLTRGYYSAVAGRCPNPTHFRAWESYTFIPGPDNKTVPFIRTLSPARHRKLTFLDADVRDTRFKVFVDGKLKEVSSDFELDTSLDCGHNVGLCLALGFSRASVVVPPGKHTVRVDWIGKDILPGTTSAIDWGRDRSRRIVWKQETC